MHSNHIICFFAVIWGRQDREPEDQQGQGALVFTYVWTVATLIFMNLYGNRVMTRMKETPEKLQYALAGIINVFFMVCVIVGALGVKSDGRVIEETGWYGQISILLFLTCLFGMVFCVFHVMWLRRKVVKESSDADAEFGYRLQEKNIDQLTKEQEYENERVEYVNATMELV